MNKIMIPCLLALAPFVSTYGQNLITNSGFEDTNSDMNFGDNWGNFGSTGFNEFFGPGNPHASFFADTAGNSGGVFQTGIAAVVGNEYTFNLTDFFVEDNFGGDITVALEFFEADDSTQISATPATLSLDITDPAPAPGSLTVTATAPSGAAFVRPLISFANADGSAGGSENFFVFDTSLTSVPEPNMAALLLGSMALGFVSIRRRRA
jgi:hypothetical protein